MDRDRFDDVARALGGASSRRALLGLVLGSAVVFLVGNDEIEARRKKKGKKKKRKKKCKPNCTGKECGSDGCGGSCGECPGDFHCMSCRDGRCVALTNDSTPCDPQDVRRHCSSGYCVVCGMVGDPCCGGICAEDASFCVHTTCSGAATNWCGEPGGRCCAWGCVEGYGCCPPKPYRPYEACYPLGYPCP